MAKKRGNYKNRKTTSPIKTFFKKFLVATLILSFIGIIIYYFREPLARYFSFKASHPEFQSDLDTKNRFDKILSLHPEKAYGIDISEYQGKINWKKLQQIDSLKPIDFILVRATAGKNRVDKKFKQNFEAIKNKKIIRGAYHYYRPNENSIKQAQLFNQTVTLKKGDLPPVLDIENIPKTQSMDSLKVGLKRWLNLVESHYNVKPIIYTGENYYQNYLKDDFEDYHFWIANYSKIIPRIDNKWRFWQFTESAKIEGINHAVDVNVFNGHKQELKKLLID